VGGVSATALILWMGGGGAHSVLGTLCVYLRTLCLQEVQGQRFCTGAPPWSTLARLQPRRS
jgi:hypothetical protein